MFKRSSDVIIPSTSQGNESKTFFLCEYCDNGWESETEVLLHKQSHVNQIKKLLEDEKPICLICLQLLDSREKLIKHVKSNHLLSSENSKRVEREIFVCDKCYGIYFNKKLLELHMRQIHSILTDKKMSVDCPKCDLTFKNKSVYSHKHLRDLKLSGLCPICLQNFKSEEEVVKHVQIHDPYFGCNVCGHHSVSASSFNVHIEQHKSSRRAKVKDNFLNDPYYIKSTTCFVPPRLNSNYMVDVGWKDWTKGLQLRDVLSICVLCRQICNTEAEMKLHELNHKFEEPKPEQNMFSCICGDSFVNRLLLKQHSLKCEVRKSDTITGF